MRQRLRIILPLLTIIFFIHISTASAEAGSAIVKKDVRHFIAVSGALLSAPFSLDKTRWQFAGCAVFGSALLTPLDGHVRTFAARNHSSLNNKLFSVDLFYGNKYTLLLPLTLYGWGLFAQQADVRMTGLRAVEAFLWAGGLNYLFKVLIGRRRPDAEGNPYFFKPFQWNNDVYQSFPSGHTAVSFAVSTVLAKSFDNIYGKIVCYGAAGMVAGARIYHNRHWLTDVFFGAALGYGVGYFIDGYKNKKTVSGRIALQTLISANGIGLALRF